MSDVIPTRSTVIGWLNALAILADTNAPLRADDIPFLDEAIRLLEEGYGND